MPGASSKVINFDHLVIGVDLHSNMPPPAPTGPVPLPHLVSTRIGDAMTATSKEADNVKAGGASAVARQHDIGMGLFPSKGPGYHTAGNALLPLVWLGAGNKCEFGTSSVIVKTGRLAVALIPFAGINMQLDCHEPGPMPRSICFARMNTVEAGFTIADCFAGFAAMAVDSIAVRLVNYVSGRVVGLLAAEAAAAVAAILAAVAPEALLVVGVALASPAGAVVAANAALVLTKTAEMLTGWFIGSPLGYSFDYPWTSWGGKLNDVVSGMISPMPTAPGPPPGLSAPAADRSDAVLGPATEYPGAEPMVGGGSTPPDPSSSSQKDEFTPSDPAPPSSKE